MCIPSTSPTSEMGDITFLKTETARDKKKLLVTLLDTNAKGTASVFLIALHISAVLSKAVLKFYNFDNGRRRKEN